MASSDSHQAASSLSNPTEQGTLALAYRKSVVALQSIFGSRDNSDQYAEREPLLSNSNDNGNGNASSSRSQYGSVAGQGPQRRIAKPKKISTPNKVEAKVWFANERTWISWLKVSVLIGSFALALFNSSTFFEKHNHPDSPGGGRGPGLDPATIKAFGAAYAAIAIATLLWGLHSYQRRVTLIKSRWPGDFDDLIGPPIICALLFIAVLLNFIVRVKQHNLEAEP
ncbi:hypothetical protein IE53DRAFT_370301 [Violaceomyces palustris]|uniref:Uncharacterized protein n=1 Tax=Violaceomyces palustris TaxID=1673888 RepID=A0ACD0NSS5_9BASI|nr:hypothetical protein IE53DRAFT_370301 [Violaceomyces palustris]